MSLQGHSHWKLWTLGVLLCLSAAALPVFLRWFEYSCLYFPDKNVTRSPDSLGMRWDSRSIVTADRVHIRAWHVKARADGAPLVIYLHGNGGNIGDYLDEASVLVGMGLDVLLVEYRGYGESAGSPSEKGFYLDAQAAYDWAAGELAPPRVVVFGRSLGTAVAADLAVNRPVSALILESPFTSGVEIGKEKFPWLPVRLIMTQKYDTISKIGRLKCPLLVLHSPDDEVVPFRMGRRLFETAAVPKAFVELRGGHNDGWSASGGVFADGVSSFIKANLK